MSHGHHGGGGNFGGGFGGGGHHHHHHHGGPGNFGGGFVRHHHHHHHRGFGRPVPGWGWGWSRPFFGPGLGWFPFGGFWGRPRYYGGYRRYYGMGGCLLPFLIVGLLALFLVAKLWWLIIPAIVLGVIALASFSRRRPGNPGGYYQQPNQPYQGNQYYQPPNQPYQQGGQPYQQYPPQYGPQAQYPNMPPNP